MKSKILQWLAIILVLEVGLVHYISSQHEFEETAVLGYLFVANFAGALLAAYGISRHKVWGWGLGFAITAGSLVGYVWSRTLGLPGLEAEAWFSAWGAVSLLAEGLFILLAFTRPWRGSSPVPGQVSLPIGLRYLLPAIGMAALVLVNYAAYQLDVLYPVEDHEHILSLRDVQHHSVISQATLEQEYGMQVSLVAVSALDSIVDVRLKILDAEKAEPLLDGHTALLVDDILILAPHMHGHSLKEGKPIAVFYPNLQNIVKSGTPVSLVFEDIRVEAVLAQ